MTDDEILEAVYQARKVARCNFSESIKIAGIAQAGSGDNEWFLGGRYRPGEPWDHPHKAARQLLKELSPKQKTLEAQYVYARLKGWI